MFLYVAFSASRSSPSSTTAFPLELFCLSPRFHASYEFLNPLIVFWFFTRSGNSFSLSLSGSLSVSLFHHFVFSIFCFPSFVDASSHLFKRVCLSVRPYVRMIVTIKEKPPGDESYCPLGLVRWVIASLYKRVCPSVSLYVRYHQGKTAENDDFSLRDASYFPPGIV